MLAFRFDAPTDRPFTILCLGAHSDDIEIGCGGTILKLTRELPDVSVRWIVFSACAERASEASRSAERFLAGASRHEVTTLDFPDRFFPYRGEEIKRWFDQLGDEIDPHVIFTHQRDDLHQDHRLICELTWNTFRSHAILEYEIPKYDGDLGRPNLFVPLDVALCRKKFEIAHECFESQRAKHWFTEDAFFALLRLRGIESASATGYAEAFYSRKGVIR